MNFEEFYDEIITSLGGNLVDVELEEKDIRFCLNRAIRTFKQKGNNSYRRDFIRLPVDNCSTVYSIPSDIETVVKVIKPSYSFVIGDEFGLAAFNDLFGHSKMTHMGDYLSYELTLQLIETWKRYLAYEVQFHVDKFKNTISFLKPAERKKDIWLLEVYRNLDETEYMDLLWIQSWTIAEAKGLLGAAYRKFPQLPGPDGSVSLDGMSLIQDSQREKEQLIEDILNGTDGEVSFYEIVMG